jgi:hypothetical protein
MSQEIRQTELREKTHQLLDGPLKHVRAAALAAALLPLASVAVAPAQAQEVCQSGGVCGFIWNDANNNGIQDGGEQGIAGASVFVFDGTETIQVYTDTSGFYSLFVATDGTYTIAVQIPQGTQASQSNVGDDALDSDGVSDLMGFGVASVTRTGGTAFATDFGFFTPSVSVPAPGTGTPGYWKNHPDAWPVASITVGGVSYTKAEAIAWLGKVSKDKTTTMFSSLVPAMLNVLIGNDGSCVSATITAANAWMATYGPVGSGVAASSAAWTIGEPLHQTLDAYNNGLLCAPHRQ